MTEPGEVSTVRWYNRLAAWIYERLDFLVGLAMPVWEEQAEQDAEDHWLEQEAEAQMMAKHAYDEGFADGAREAERDYR